MAAESADRVRRHRLRQAGYEKNACPENTSREDCLAWAEGVWKRQARDMPARTRRDDTKVETRRGVRK